MTHATRPAGGETVPRRPTPLRRTCTVLLLVLAAAGCSDSPTDDDAPDPDLTVPVLANGDVEQGTAQPLAWVTGESSAEHVLEWTSRESLSGDRSLAIESSGVGPTSEGAFWVQRISVVGPVPSLVLNASVKVEEVTGEGVAVALRADVTTQNTGQAAAFASTQDVQFIGGTEGWARVTVPLNGIPSDADLISVFLLHLPNSSGAAFFDDISLSAPGSAAQTAQAGMNGAGPSDSGGA